MLVRLGFEPAGLIVGSATEAVSGRGSDADVLRVPTPTWYRGTPHHPVLLGAPEDAYQALYPCPHRGPSAVGHSVGYSVEDRGHEDGLRATLALALERLVGRAEAMGAHGLVGVAVSRRFVGGRRVDEVRVEGAAVRARGPSQPGVLFAAGVSPSALSQLFGTGRAPVAPVAGLAVVHVREGCRARRSTRSLANREMTQLSQAMGAARRLVIEDLEARVAGLGGDGVVGVRVDLAVHPVQKGCTIEMMALGTAVRSFGQVGPRPSLAPVIDLASGPRRPRAGSSRPRLLIDEPAASHLRHLLSSEGFWETLGELASGPPG
ncbi:MAG: heavy metal-binding domain-containing protein [Acidimicrobiales bacterium]